ncbi:hypothetical protein SKAU_G00026780 [Synaphobranchus kaupii]|uniref:Uncharacterized protein n=1 Tax=Synaphobranchus kaupii TaxID=118154 RepID=A0A9Q1JEI4_SYNKA|nr:hypothetical protein SKAU_G00026780 [Synaphobranchus kaupii]
MYPYRIISSDTVTLISYKQPFLPLINKYLEKRTFVSLAHGMSSRRAADKWNGVASQRRGRVLVLRDRPAAAEAPLRRRSNGRLCQGSRPGRGSHGCTRDSCDANQ